MNSMICGMNGNGRERGFTLLELLVTIAIIAVIVGMGVPMYGTFTQESSVSGATSEFIASINDARSLATTERTTIRVRALGGDWNNGWETVRVNDAADDSDDEILFTSPRNNPQVSISEATDITEIDFDREGRATVSDFTVEVAAGESGAPIRSIGLTAFGRIELAHSTVP